LRHLQPVWIVKAIIFCVPLVIVAWLTVDYLSIFGNLSITYNFSGESARVKEFTPAGRALDREQNLRTGETYQRIVGEPVYMNVTVPRSYDDVSVTLDYQNDGQPYTEFGLVTSEEPLSVRLQSLDIGIINQAINEGWSQIESDGVTLLQRQSEFESVADFVDQTPEDQGIGVYRYRLSYRYTDSSYVASPQKQVIDRVLRGGHEFWTYIDKETLHAEFDLTDINRDFNEDPISIQVYRVNTIIHEELLPDDGDALASAVATDRGTLTVDLAGLEAGLYRIVVNVDDDILISQIRTDQERFVARDKVFLVNNSEYAEAVAGLDTGPTTLYLQGTELMMQTDHTSGLQVPTIAGEPLHIDKLHVPYWWESQDEVEPLFRELITPKNDLLVRTSGLIAFSEDAFFDADYQIEQISGSTALEDLDYIIFKEYTAPVADRGGYLQTIPLSLDGVVGDRKELKFILSAPGIERNGHEIKVREVKFDFHRADLWTKLKSRFGGSS